MLTVRICAAICVSGASLLLLAAGATVAKAPPVFTVHEWGTFLVMNGSDGVTLDGMYHEEHSLPGFVHARSKDQLRVPAVSVKGETPVIYFYADQPLDLSVRVKFPQGLWTQWYPQAQFNGPTTAQAGSPPTMKNGHISWRVKVTPPGTGRALILPKTPEGSLWNYARDVDAAYVRPDDRAVHAPGEVERFIFYRGLGHAKLPLKMTTAGTSVLSYDAGESLPLRHLFILRKEHGRGVYRYVPSLRPGESLTDAIPALTGALPQAEFSRRIGDDLAARLTSAGLYPKEARAMVKTWRSSYFESDGVRVLFVLPQSWTDKFIPMDIEPKPTSTVRVMVGRLEVLTPERELEAANAVRDLGSMDERQRESAYTFLKEQGRYLEPILRRTLRTSSDSRVQATCKRLLLTDFVTELQSAVGSRGGAHSLSPQISQISQIENGSNSDAKGGRETELDARAQLAALLREIGLNDRGAAEARRILPEVQRMREPGLNQSEYRPYARIHARTMEALGDEAGAAQWYARFVKFGSQTAQCGGCHGAQGPRDMAFYRDWWAGRKYAYYTARTQTLKSAIAQQTAAVKADPRDPAAGMMLAYLSEHKGDTATAERLWTLISGPAARPVSQRGGR